MNRRPPPKRADAEHIPDAEAFRAFSTGPLCGGCWKRFPVDDLVEVAETTGRGYRCRECAAKIAATIAPE